MPWTRKRRATTPLDITSTIPTATAGNLLIWRDGNTVWMHFKNLVVSDVERPDMINYNVIPVGFRPLDSFELPLGPRVFGSTNEVNGSARIYGTTLVLYRVPAGGFVRGLVSFPTNDPMPAGGA